MLFYLLTTAKSQGAQADLLPENTAKEKEERHEDTQSWKLW